MRTAVRVGAALGCTWMIIGSAGVTVGAAAPPEQTHNTENFSITWVADASHPDAPDLTDADASGVPDEVELMAAAFEGARAFALVELGYREPPGPDHYPLYVARGAGGGSTHSLPGGTGRSKPSFIAVSPGYLQGSTRASQMRALAVHEYMHAIQIGYDSEEDQWIQEASSTWIQDQFVDDIDSSHASLPSFVPLPRSSLSASDGDHEYGAFIFLQFLTERYGGGSVEGRSIVRELWEQMAVPEAIPGAPDQSSLAAIESVLARRGVSLDDAWGEFLLWERQLSKYEEGSAYRKALNNTGWRAVLRTTTPRRETCRLTTDTSLGQGLPFLSGDNVMLAPAANGPKVTTARLTVEGQPGVTGFYLTKPRLGKASEHRLSFDDRGVATADVDFGRSKVRRIVVGLGNGAPSGDEATIAYSLRLRDENRVRASAPSSSSSTIFGTGLRASGEVSCGGRPAPFADIVITGTEVVSGITETRRTTTNAEGTWFDVLSPDANATYTVTVDDPLLSPATSGATSVGVRISVTATPAPSTVPEGSPITFSGTVEPAHPGVPVSIEFRRPEGTWEELAEVPIDQAGNYSASVTLPDGGVWELRALVADTGDADHLPGGTPGRLVFVEPADQP